MSMIIICVSDVARNTVIDICVQCGRVSYNNLSERTIEKYKVSPLVGAPNHRLPPSPCHSKQDNK